MNVIALNPQHPDGTLIDEVVAQLERGAVVAYPTETVYGIGCDATNTQSAAHVLRVKTDRKDAKMIVLVSGYAMLERYFVLNEAARALATQFWPGPLTLILPFTKEGQRDLQRSVNPGSDNGAVRISSHVIASELVHRLGRPLISSSANPAGKPPARDSEKVLSYFAYAPHQPEILIDVGILSPSNGSTIVDARNGEIKVLREGDIQIHEMSNI